MEFIFTDEQVMIGETAKAFFSENATSERTRAAMAGTGIDRALWDSFCTELGLSGIGLPEAMGGAGLGMVEFAIISEAAGAQVAALPLLGLATVAQALAAGGTAAQQGEDLPNLVSGGAIGAFAESDDLRFADGVLNGSAAFVAHGAVADLFLLAAQDGAWLVKAGTPGLTITAHTTMDQTRPYATLTLANVAAAPLADAKAAVAAARAGACVCLSAEALGGAQAALDRTVAYAKDRIQFGRPIGSFQAYKHRLADMVVEIEQARSAVYWAACTVDEGSDEAALALHAAKSFAADTFFKCAADMIQLHGGIGFTWEHDAHLFFKRARAIQTMMGSGQWHREQVATMILGEAA